MIQFIDIAIDELSNITGQKAVAMSKKKKISQTLSFVKHADGARVTLRGEKMC
jgi:large subunit ribosomal protein L5